MEKFVVPELFKKFEEKIKPTIQITNEITFHRGEGKQWESKLGGCFYLQNENEYPNDSDGNPYMFFAQINLEDIKEIDYLPNNGLLQFFVKNNDLWGLDEEDGVYVRYIEKFDADVSKLLMKNPYEEEMQEFLPFTRECKMSFSVKEMPMTVECEAFNQLFTGVVFDEKQEDELFEAFSGAGSRVGGYPCFTQSDPREVGKYDILLLQLDVDDEADMMFGDSGVANFFINMDDVLKKDFSKVYFTWDCC